MTCVRCDELRAELRELKRELEATAEATMVARFRSAYRLTPQEARLMAALYDKGGRVLSASRLEQLLPMIGRKERDTDHIVKVLISRIRKKMGRDVINTEFGSGWYLTPQGREKVAEVVG